MHSAAAAGALACLYAVVSSLQPFDPYYCNMDLVLLQEPVKCEAFLHP